MQDCGRYSLGALGYERLPGESRLHLRRLLSQEPGWQAETEGHGAPLVVQASASPVFVHWNVITGNVFLFELFICLVRGSSCFQQ